MFFLFFNLFKKNFDLLKIEKFKWSIDKEAVFLIRKQWSVCTLLEKQYIYLISLRVTFKVGSRAQIKKEIRLKTDDHVLKFFVGVILTFGSATRRYRPQLFLNCENAECAIWLRFCCHYVMESISGKIITFPYSHRNN